MAGEDGEPPGDVTLGVSKGLGQKLTARSKMSMLPPSEVDVLCSGQSSSTQKQLCQHLLCSPTCGDHHLPHGCSSSASPELCVSSVSATAPWPGQPQGPRLPTSPSPAAPRGPATAGSRWLSNGALKGQ